MAWRGILSLIISSLLCCLLPFAQACDNDALEFPSRNDNFINSTYVALPVYAPTLTICPAGDNDFFRWMLQKDTALSFYINCNDPSLRLVGWLWGYKEQYKGYGSSLILDSVEMKCNYTETLPPAPENTWWFFQIKSNDANATGSYSLAIKEGPLCTGSNTNVDRASAEQIVLPSEKEFSACPSGHEQWFKIAMEIERNITISFSDCAKNTFPPKDLIGVWIDGDTETLILNATKQQCTYGLINLPLRNISDPYYLRVFSPVNATGPFKIRAALQTLWTIVPPHTHSTDNGHESHGYLAILVLLLVFTVILCGAFALWWQRQSQQEGEQLLESFVAQQREEAEEEEEERLHQEKIAKLKDETDEKENLTVLNGNDQKEPGMEKEKLIEPKEGL